MKNGSSEHVGEEMSHDLFERHVGILDEVEHVVRLMKAIGVDHVGIADTIGVGTPRRVQAALLGLVPGEPLMSADNLASLSVPNVATPGAPGLRELGIAPAALEQVMPALLARGPTRLDALRRLARRG